MTKFKIIETKQKVEEATKLQQVGQKTADFVQSLANIGRIFGMKTEFLTTMTNLISNVASWSRLFKKEYTDNENKVIKALISGSPQVQNVIQRSLVLAETPSTVPQNKQPQQQQQPQTKTKPKRKTQDNKPLSDEEFAKQLAIKKKQAEPKPKRIPRKIK